MNTPAKATKDLAKKIAKQAFLEPTEILKDVKEQVVGIETPPHSPNPLPQNPENSQKDNAQELQADKLKSTRLVAALDRELKDISRENLFKSLQKKISEGEWVYIDEFSELSMEQKQVLNAQQEAVNAQKIQEGGTASLIEPDVKRGRRMFGGGQKAAAQKQTTRVEKPVPPSG